MRIVAKHCNFGEHLALLAHPHTDFLTLLFGKDPHSTGSDHIREKDGLWAVLFWLNLIAIRQQSVADIMKEHWKRFGRHYYSRHDYEEVDKERAEELMATLKNRQAELKGQSLDGYTLAECDDFSYTDPIDNSCSENQGLRFLFEDGSRLIFRLSGTGTAGATLRVYIERYEPDPEAAARYQTLYQRYKKVGDFIEKELTP